jgi:hypothetical protein
MIEKEAQSLPTNEPSKSPYLTPGFSMADCRIDNGFCPGRVDSKFETSAQK